MFSFNIEKNKKIKRNVLYLFLVLRQWKYMLQCISLYCPTSQDKANDVHMKDNKKNWKSLHKKDWIDTVCEKYGQFCALGDYLFSKWKLFLLYEFFLFYLSNYLLYIDFSYQYYNNGNKHAVITSSASTHKNRFNKTPVFIWN